MRKLLATLALTITATVFGAGVGHADSPAPTNYGCIISHGTDPGCDTLPGVWNDWAGRVTPTRWDPCVNGKHTLLYVQGCTRRSVSVATWCGLHFDHGFYGTWCADHRRK
jgi:hypothetical protein